MYFEEVCNRSSHLCLGQGYTVWPCAGRFVSARHGIFFHPLFLFSFLPHPAQSIDKAPSPFKHTRSLYNGKTKAPSSRSMSARHGNLPVKPVILVRSELHPLQNANAKRGWMETVDHFLFRCPLWSDFRKEIRRLAGPRWADTSYLLLGPNTEMINAAI